MLLMVMVGFCFSKIATSSFHSLCCCGALAGGAQSTLIVTWPPLAELLAAGLLEHAAAPSPRAATTVRPAIWRWLAHLGSCLLIHSSFAGIKNIDSLTFLWRH